MNKKLKIMNHTENFKKDTKIIKIDHYYNTDHDALSRFIETSISIEAMVRILACLQFIFEDLVDESMCMDERHITKILEQFYGGKDVTEDYQEFLPQMQLNEEDWEIINTFSVQKEDGTSLEITQIDLYEARECCCGPRYKEMMEDVLPNTKEFIAEIKNPEFY